MTGSSPQKITSGLQKTNFTTDCEDKDISMVGRKIITPVKMKSSTKESCQVVQPPTGQLTNMDVATLIRRRQGRTST